LLEYGIASTWASRQTYKRWDYNWCSIRRSTVRNSKVVRMSLAIYQSFIISTTMTQPSIIESYLCFLQDLSQVAIRNRRKCHQSIIEENDHNLFSESRPFPRFSRRKSLQGSSYWEPRRTASHTISCRVTSISSTWLMCTSFIQCNRWHRCTTAS